VLWVVLVI